MTPSAFRELSRDAFLHRSLRWLQRTTMALTTPSSQEAQSTFRTWSDHLYCCGVRGQSAAGLHPQFTWDDRFHQTVASPSKGFLDMCSMEFVVMIQQIMHLRRRKEDSLLRMLPYYFKSSLYQIQSLRAQSCQRLLRPLWVLTVMMSVPQCHIATHMHTQCAVYSPVALWTHASRCARLHRQVTCFICCSFLLCFLRFIFLWQQ